MKTFVLILSLLAVSALIYNKKAGADLPGTARAASTAPAIKGKVLNKNDSMFMNYLRLRLDHRYLNAATERVKGEGC